MAKKRARRRSRRKSPGRLSFGRVMLCALVECIVLAVLAVIVGWDRGVGEWVAGLRAPVVRKLELDGISSPYAILIQAKGGKVIGELHGDEKIYPASMTKIMTAVVALEELEDLDREITLGSGMFAELYAGDATQAGFQPGETVRALDLLYGVLLPSGAECCVGLAEEIAGSEEAFAELMNKKADKLGMENTHFCDSTGLHDPEHYSTPHDMAVLLKYAIRNRTFREIIESPWHSTPATNVHPDGITFYSTLFKNLPDPSVTGGEILGGKTGYTGEAGHCLASYARIEGREYILVTAGAPDDGGTPHIRDARILYDRLGEAARGNS